MNIRDRKGQIIIGVLAATVVILIIVGSVVKWLQNDTKWAVKNQKTVDAYNLAEAGQDRASWKLQSTTTTWNAAATGTIIPGYNFDTTYTDIPGGTYRIKLSTGISVSGLPTVIITSEGRDIYKNETRAIQAVVENQTIYSAMMSGGSVTWSKGLGVFWGPIMTQGNIQLMDDVVASLYYPRKFAKGVVMGTVANPRDTNGLTPPNTDNVEWWSAYNGVPNVPILDFAALRSSAAASGTLNVYGCKNSSPVGAWDARASCSSLGNHNLHFGNPWNHPLSAKFNPNTDYVWYWDGDVTLSGNYCGGVACNQSTGLRGTFIIRGNLTIDTPGEYNYTGHVPANAWQEENKLTKNTFDTAAVGEYPADIGLHQSAATYNFGTDLSCIPNAGCNEYATVGLRGFVYIGGNLTVLQYMDFNGAVWVNGAVNAAGGTNTTFCSIFYNDTLQVPALNVILLRLSWKETPASPLAWP